jgi:hypothetical protein
MEVSISELLLSDTELQTLDQEKNCAGPISVSQILKKKFIFSIQILSSATGTFTLLVELLVDRWCCYESFVSVGTEQICSTKSQFPAELNFPATCKGC